MGKGTWPAASRWGLLRQCGRPGCLPLVSGYVKRNKATIITFKEDQTFALRLGGLEETFYDGQPAMLGYWEKLYLPRPVKMEVLGSVDDVPCLATGQQLLILVAGDGRVYAYEEERLHVVGGDLEEFLTVGLQRFGKEVYECAEGLASEEEKAKDPEIREIRQSTRDFVNSKADAFQKHLDFLKSL